MAGWAGLFRPRPRKSGDKFLLHVFGSDPILALQPMGGGGGEGGALESWGALKGFGMGSWGVGVCGVALGGGAGGSRGGLRGSGWVWRSGRGPGGCGVFFWEGSYGGLGCQVGGLEGGVALGSWGGGPYERGLAGV